VKIVVLYFLANDDTEFMEHWVDELGDMGLVFTEMKEACIGDQFFCIKCGSEMSNTDVARAMSSRSGIMLCDACWLTEVR
jgi:hypothetical protein